MQWALAHPERAKAANELPEAERPRPCIKIPSSVYNQFSDMISSKTRYVPSKTVENLVQIFGGSDLLRALVAADIKVINLPETKRMALIIPVPDMKRFNPKPAFGDSTAHTWALVHGTFVPGATAILIEGLIRPADWEHNDDPQRSQLPTFGFFGIGTTPLKFPLQKGRP